MGSHQTLIHIGPSGPEAQRNIDYWAGSSAERAPVEIRDGRVNFRCLADQCPTPCCGPFQGLGRDVTPCFVSSFADLYLLDEDLTRLIDAGRADLVEHGPQGYKLKLQPDSSCAAFQNGLCSIHQLRPAVCRAFPFDFDLFAGLVMISKCPGVNAGWSEPHELAEAVTALRSVYQRWITANTEQILRDVENACGPPPSPADLPEG